MNAEDHVAQAHVLDLFKKMHKNQQARSLRCNYDAERLSHSLTTGQRIALTIAGFVFVALVIVMATITWRE